MRQIGTDARAFRCNGDLSVKEPNFFLRLFGWTPIGDREIIPRYTRGAEHCHLSGGGVCEQDAFCVRDRGNELCCSASLEEPGDHGKQERLAIPRGMAPAGRLEDDAALTALPSTTATTLRPSQGRSLRGATSRRPAFRVADAIGFMQKRELGEVPSFVSEWRARQESNL